MKKTYLWLTAIALLFVVLNWQVPLVIDDYPYSRSWVGITQTDEDQDIHATIDGVADLMASQASHYQAVNGRALVHTVVQVFCCWAGQVPFDILQGVMLLLCIVFTGRLLSSRNPLAGTAVLLMMMTLFREPNCYYHGIACSVNYLWVMTTVLALRWFYLCQSEHHPALLAILAFVAGFSNEAYAIPFAVAFLLEMLAQWRTTTRAQRIAVATMCIGVLLLVAAPSNFHRLTATQNMDNASSLPLHLQPLLNLRLTMLCLISTLIFGIRHSWRFVRENHFWYVVILVSSLLSMAIGGENIRQCVAAELASAILLTRMARQSLATHLHGYALNICAASVCLLFVGINVIQRPMSRRFEEVKGEVETSQEEHVVVHTQDISLPMQIEKYRCCELSDFQLYQLKWWYSKESVSVVFQDSDLSRTK